MIKIENKFARHGVFWIYTLPIVGILVMPMLIRADKFSIDEVELLFFKDVLGRDIDAATISANYWFKTLFIETGIFAAVNDFLRGGLGFFGAVQKGEVIVHNISTGYTASLWKMIYRGIWRMSALWPVIVSIVVCLAIPAAVDGLCVRAKKAYTFSMQNPVYFWTATHSFIMVLGVSLFIPLTPISMTPLFIAGIAAAMCIAAWITASNFQTGN